MVHTMNNIILIVLPALLMTSWISCAPALDNEHRDRLTGQTLVDMGDRLNKPLLKLVGKTLLHVENEIKETFLNMTETSSLTVQEVVTEMCRLHPCSDWSNWSNCDANKTGEFGGQNRSRNCGLNTTYCGRHSIPTVEYDTRVCEGKCPSNYVVTKHGFCLKFYNNDKNQRDDAETVCQTDGGHLVHIDSIIKVQDVNETILDQKYSGQYLWIDGRRSEQAGPWKYGYPSAEPSFTFWGDNDPDNGVKDLCMLYYKGSSTGNSWRWFDFGCGSQFDFICELQ